MTKSIWFSVAPSQIGTGQKRWEFKRMVELCSQFAWVVPFAINDFGEEHEIIKTRSYQDRMGLVESADLVVALYPSNGGSDSRGIEVHARLISQRPILVAVQNDVLPTLSEFQKGMFSKYGAVPVGFDRYADLVGAIQEKLGLVTADH